MQLASRYFQDGSSSRVSAGVEPYQAALDRCVAKVKAVLPQFGLRNPKIGNADLGWTFCSPRDWVVGFFSGQLWLAATLTGDPVFREAAQARRPAFRYILEHRHARDHDLGFQFSLHAVADWRVTGSTVAREMALHAAQALLARFDEAGQYLQAWNTGPDDPEMARFTRGRMIADTMQNLALLHWAHRETGIDEFREVAELHAQTTRCHIVRADGSSYHTFRFDPVTGEPLGGQTVQGAADESCWSRGQAWLIHGFAQCHAATGTPAHLDTARLLAATAEALMGDERVPVWDWRLAPDQGPRHLDSSAGAIMAAGLYLLADQTAGDEAARWRAFADRLLDGLLAQCDLSGDVRAMGLLAHGAAHVREGRFDTMLPYGDYYFMEALMRSLGHTQFFW